jgi:hypothetical protein
MNLRSVARNFVETIPEILFFGIVFGRFLPANLFNYSQQFTYKVSVVKHLPISRILFIIANSAPTLQFKNPIIPVDYSNVVHQSMPEGLE